MSPLARLTREDAKKEIARLAGTRFFPTSPLAISEMVDALLRVWRDKQQAHDIITACLESSSECPTPHDILEAARQLYVDPSAARDPAAPPDCEACWDTGWRQVLKNGDSGVEPCSCARGKVHRTEQ